MRLVLQQERTVVQAGEFNEGETVVCGDSMCGMWVSAVGLRGVLPGPLAGARPHFAMHG